MALHTPETAAASNLLLADDDAALRLLYARTLEGYFRFNSDIVNGVSSALSAMATRQYAVVISDGLYGGWTEVLGAAMEQEAHPILYSADLDAVQFATNIGVEAYDKGRFTLSQMLDLTLNRFPN